MRIAYPYIYIIKRKSAYHHIYRTRLYARVEVIAGLEIVKALGDEIKLGYQAKQAEMN